MSRTISGTYVAGRSCALLCSCPYDGLPWDAGGGTECRGTAVFHVADGNLDDLDLSDVDFAFRNLFSVPIFGLSYEVSYGETADYVFSSKEAERPPAAASERNGVPEPGGEGERAGHEAPLSAGGPCGHRGPGESHTVHRRHRPLQPR